MLDFIQTIFYTFGRAIGPAVLAMIFGTTVWAKVYGRLHKDEDKLPPRRVVPVALLFAYLGGLLTITLLLRQSGDSAIQWHLFRAFREAWNAFTVRTWLNPLLNIGMFVPLGVLLPLTGKLFRRWYVTLAAGLGVSLLIEAVQYVFVLGSADVDDLLCNTLGTALGFCLCMTAVSLIEKRWRPSAAYAVLPILSAAVLAGIFIVYQLQPYGNLADAPAFAADTSGIRWVLECELSDQPGPAGVYWAEPFTRESCDAFALAFAQRRGVDITGEFFDITYYDDSNFYSDHSTFCVIVQLNDRSYEYHDYRVDSFGSVGTASEEGLRAALADLGIQVPEQAQFIEEGNGRYTFRADRIEDGDSLTDGQITCSVAEGGAIYSVKNELSVSTRYGDAAVISQREAYDRLRRGEFSRGDWFEYQAFQEVHVTSCELRYLIDSKGFRQPVYQFGMEGLWDTVFVPALAG